MQLVELLKLSLSSRKEVYLCKLRSKSYFRPIFFICSYLNWSGLDESQLPHLFSFKTRVSCLCPLPNLYEFVSTPPLFFSVSCSYNFSNFSFLGPFHNQKYLFSPNHFTIQIENSPRKKSSLILSFHLRFSLLLRKFIFPSLRRRLPLHSPLTRVQCV